MGSVWSCANLSTHSLEQFRLICFLFVLYFVSTGVQSSILVHVLSDRAPEIEWGFGRAASGSSPRGFPHSSTRDCSTRHRGHPAGCTGRGNAKALSIGEVQQATSRRGRGHRVCHQDQRDARGSSRVGPVKAAWKPHASGTLRRHDASGQAWHTRLVGLASSSFMPLHSTTISDQPGGTFARLRYILGDDRPSQTAHLKRFLGLIATRLELLFYQSGISFLAQNNPQVDHHSLPPILRKYNPSSIPRYSKAS
jgi:hypothetical protein